MEKVKAIGGAVQAAWSSASTNASPEPPVPSRPPSPPLAAPATDWAGPAVPPSAPPAPPQPTTDPTVLLDALVASVDGVRGAILASVDGFGLARSTSLEHEPAHPAMLAAAVGLAHQLVEMGGGDTLRQLLVDHDAGLLLIWPIGDQRVLAVLAANAVDQRGARSYVQRHVDVLAQVDR